MKLTSELCAIGLYPEHARLIGDAVGTVRLEEFGAKGDGTTDDTAAIQTAVNYAAGRYLTLILSPNKTYLISNVTLPPYARIVARSETRSQSVFKATGSSNMFTVTASPYAEKYVCFEGVSFDGNKTAAACVSLEGGVQNTRFRRCVFKNFLTGVDIDYALWTYFDACEFNGEAQTTTPTVTGVLISGASNATYLNWVNFGGSLDYCIHSDASWSGTSLYVADCCFDNILNTNTVHLDHTTAAPAIDVVVMNCRFDGASNGAHIYIGEQIWGACVRDSSFADTCVNNISVAGWYAFIHNNHLADATGAAIDLLSTSKWCEIGMQSWGSSAGVDIADAGTENKIHRKILKGATAARPAPLATEYGRMYLDTTLDADGLPIFWQGTKWIKADGADA